MGFTGEKKKKIKQRDGNVCIACGSNGQKRLCIHHIDGDRENNEEENLVTLCFDHHTAVETALNPFHLGHSKSLLLPWQYSRYREEAEEAIEAINDREDLYTIGLETESGEELPVLPEPKEVQNKPIRVVVHSQV